MESLFPALSLLHPGLWKVRFLPFAFSIQACERNSPEVRSYPFHNLDSPPNKPWDFLPIGAVTSRHPRKTGDVPKVLELPTTQSRNHSWDLHPLMAGHLFSSRKAVTSIRECYSLNVYIPPNSYVEIPVPKGDGISKWQIWKMHSYERGTLIYGISAS